MATDIKVPAVGESITEGTVARWLKQDGAAVRADEPLFELETDKATTEVAAPAAGTLRISVREGQTVPIGTVVGRIEEGGASPPPAAERKNGNARVAPATPDGLPKQEKTAPAAKPEPAAAAPAPAEVLLSPSARHLAQEQGVDVRQLTGTGPGGRITKGDVLKHLEQRPTQPPPPAPASAPKPKEAQPGLPPAPRVEKPKAAEVAGPRETRQRMSTIRQRIAERLVAAQHTAALLTTFNEADLSAVLALRNRYKDIFKEKHGVGLGFMSFFIKAAVAALRAYPVVNAWIDGNEVVYHNFYHIGVAVSTERGLMVPVVRDADRLDFAEVEKRVAELAHKARDGKITVDDLQGGTFTITNGGVFGSLLSTPILNPPQSAILGMHTIQKRPVAVDDAVVIRPMMYLALTYDHRLIDGRDAVLFLVRIKESVQDPERLLLEI
jgi:2-oxoglutarate dehydrogenase E2 component (dihydrolipoamide succinyltransferase)